MTLIFWGSPRLRDSKLQVLMTYMALGMQTMLDRFRNEAMTFNVGKFHVMSNKILGTSLFIKH